MRHKRSDNLRRLISVFRLGAGAAVVTALATLPVASAQTLQPETEPNNTPALADPVQGPITIIGSLSAGDQDGFMWSVSDVDAGKYWTVELAGIPGGLTVVDVIRVEFADDGKGVAAQKKLFTIGSRDGAQPVRSAPLILEPGDYLLGVAGAGGSEGFRPPSASLSFGDESSGSTELEATGAYRLQLLVGDRIPTSSRMATNTTQANAQELKVNRAAAAYGREDASWYAFAIGGEEVAQRWDLDVHVPVGREGNAYLRDGNGKLLSRVQEDRFGAIRLPDLGLPVGQYSIEISGAKDALHSVALNAAGVRVEGEEAEPNNKWANANRASLSVPITGRLAPARDSDYFAISIDEETADQSLKLVLASVQADSVELCLLESGGASIQCRRGNGGVELPNLSLPPGDYGLLVNRGKDGFDYTLTLEQTGALAPLVEAEPNDNVKWAMSIPAKNRVKGRFTGRETDTYRFVVTDEPQLWRFQVMGEGIREVMFYDGAGIQSQRRRANGEKRVRLENVYLLPGTHYVGITGEDGDYTFLARALGSPNANAEREPNDDETRMQKLTLGQTRIGLLADTEDVDSYRFSLANWDHIRLTAKAPVDGSIRADLRADGSVFGQATTSKGGSITREGVFPPGDYTVVLRAATPSDAEYALSLERLQRYACNIDCEPNDIAAFASPMPPSLTISGVAQDWRDVDYYTLPVLTKPSGLSVKAEQSARITIVDENDAPTETRWDAASGAFVATLPANEKRFIRVGGQGSYTLALNFADGPVAAGQVPTAQISLRLDEDSVAAYSRYAQTIKGTLTVDLADTSARGAELLATSSDARWRVDIDAPKSLTVGSATYPVRVHVPADAWGNAAVRISVAAHNNGVTLAEAGADVMPDSNVLPVAPSRYWPVPDALLGAFNIASPALGAERLLIVEERNEGKIPNLGTGFHELIDGLAVDGKGLELRGDRTLAPEVTVKLAGDAQPVHGFSLHPLGATDTSRQLRDFRVYLSSDGVDFTEALAGRLSPAAIEQYFVLDAPVNATHARLELLNNWSKENGIGLGEWKVFGAPDGEPNTGTAINLADPALGGHVVHSRPQVSGNWDRVMLTEAAENESIRLKQGETFTFVLGFSNNRAAQPARLEWVNAAKMNPAQAFDKVKVSYSLESPVGPWLPLADWQLSESTTLAVPQDRWVRFLRFEAAARGTQDQHWPPETLRVLERPVDNDYRSVVAEWGMRNSAGPYERSQLAAPVAATFGNNTAKQSAMALGFEKPVARTAQLGEREAWYTITMPPGQNQLLIQTDGDPTVRVSAQLFDNGGAELPLDIQERTSARQVYTAWVEPGASYFLRVAEPSRSVAFLWDTSASVGPFLPVIYNSLVSYADDLEPGEDAANYVPFGGRPLLNDWYGEPYVLQTLLNDYPRSESSSDAEKTLATASRALSRREGTRAIVLMTDAATTRYGEVWRLLEEVQPKIFSIGVSSAGAFGGDPAQEMTLMQDWAQVSGGHYTYNLSAGDLEVAFERAAAMLRQPVAFTLTLSSASLPEPGPGTLEVTSDTSAGSGGIALILDASGSMLKRVDGKRRINIARDVLGDAVTNRIPAGTPVSLRVFGHKEPDSCRTDLEVKLGPLDPVAMSATIASVEAKNLARTPIADSLAKIASDLRGAQGKKTVLLLTDGEETCDGDPGKAIEKLRSQGLDVTVNIVGFAISDEATEEQFENWAAIGGGRYFSAADQDTLAEAVNLAVGIPFEVFDSAGNRIADGIVGGKPIEIPSGSYELRSPAISGAPIAVRVTAGRLTRTSL